MFPPPCLRYNIHRLSYNFSEPYGGIMGLYNPSKRDTIRSNWSNDMAHAVEEMTWSRNTRNHLRSPRTRAGQSKPKRSHTESFISANHDRKEAIIHNAVWRPKRIVI